jgi:UDP-N-acetylmuramoylalanine-D-glutamate ligase
MELRKKHQNDALIVLEVSSFMAYNIETFHPDFTVFTNFQADHLNWHGTLEEYFLSKWNLITHTKHEVFLNEQITFFLRELSSTHSTNLQQNISYF